MFVKSPRKIFQITILNLKFEFPAHTSKHLFKFQAQDSDLEYLFWIFEKYIPLSEKDTFSKIDYDLSKTLDI